jgi:hypothetical protein
MFDSHRQVFTTVHGTTWLMAIGKSACRVNITFMVQFIRECNVNRGPLLLHIGCLFILTEKKFNGLLLSLCVLALSARCSTVSSTSGRS